MKVAFAKKVFLFAHFVNSQLVCLLPVGVFNEFLFIYDILFPYLQCPQLAQQC